jgi:hypothetical protein
MDVTDDLRHFDAGYRLGWSSCYPIAYSHGESDSDDRWTSALTGCTDSWRSPRQDELRAARVVDNQPCSTRCRRCSRCLRSITYWARGGRDFLGVEAEALLTSGVSNETPDLVSS